MSLAKTQTRSKRARFTIDPSQTYLNCPRRGKGFYVISDNDLLPDRAFHHCRAPKFRQSTFLDNITFGGRRILVLSNCKMFHRAVDYYHAWFRRARKTVQFLLSLFYHISWYICTSPLLNTFLSSESSLQLFQYTKAKRHIRNCLVPQAVSILFHKIGMVITNGYEQSQLQILLSMPDHFKASKSAKPRFRAT